MSLDNLQLPPLLLSDLYKKCLVNLQYFLGGNGLHISIIIDEPDAQFLKDQDLTFLTGILSACGLSLEDIALINLNKTPAINYKSISDELGARIVILFGITPEALQLPLVFPVFQVQGFNQQKFLHSPSLKQLQENREDKKKLWDALKKLFVIS